MLDYVKLLSDDGFRGLMNDCTKMAEANLKDRPSDSFMPRLHVFCAEGLSDPRITQVWCQLAVNFNEDDEKRSALLHVAKDLVARKKIVLGAVLISEAWLAMQKKGPHIEPRHDPDRQEILVAMGSKLANRFSLLANIPIARVRGLMRPCSGWQWEDGKVNSPLLQFFFDQYCSLAADAFTPPSSPAQTPPASPTPP